MGLREFIEAVNPNGHTFSCISCHWSGLTPDVSNGSIMIDDEKVQTYQTVCPACGAGVAPERNVIQRHDTKR